MEEERAEQVNANQFAHMKPEGKIWRIVKERRNLLGKVWNIMILLSFTFYVFLGTQQSHQEIFLLQMVVLLTEQIFPLQIIYLFFTFLLLFEYFH